MTKQKPNLRAMFETNEAATSTPAHVEAEQARVPVVKKDSHPGKKPVLIHIPETMHKDLRRVALEEGIPLTQITERLLRQFLVTKGYTNHAAK
jgi:hypothetical protein